MLKVIKAGLDESQAITLADEISALNNNIEETEKLLQSLGYESALGNTPKAENSAPTEAIVVRSFDDLLREANEKHPTEVSFLDIFAPEEISANSEYIRTLNEEFNSIHRLDSVDIISPAVAGILGGVVDCALGGFIQPDNGKRIPGPLSDYVGKLFDKGLPHEKIKELEKLAKVTYDATNNKTTTIPVDGLSPYFHRLVSLGHDPILGFIFGVLDMLRGTMTTLDFKGKFVIQAMDAYSDRKAQNLFESISKVFLHMLSDVNTPAGLPVPFMALFNNLQFGAIGEDKLNVSEMVKSMHGQGYDFRHFCAMSIPVMITEVIVRVCYFAKRLCEGHTFVESIPLSTSHEKKPKLGTMLFIAHSASTAINAGKVALSKEPLNINYPQWLSFAEYSIKEFKWVLYDKPQLRDKYVRGVIDDEWSDLYDELVVLWQDMAENTNVIYKIR